MQASMVVCENTGVGTIRSLYMHEVLSAYVEHVVKKPAMILCLGSASTCVTQEEFNADINKIKKSAKWLDALDGHTRSEILSCLMLEGTALVFFDTEQQRDDAYSKTDGDDTGGCIYALTMDASGNFLNENT